MKIFARFFPCLVVALGALYLVPKFLPPKDPEDGMHLWALAQVPVMDAGRIKPLDTVARLDLMLISNKQTFTDEEGNEQPAIKWLMEVMSSNATAWDRKVFRIDNDAIREKLGLKAQPGNVYSLRDIQKSAPWFLRLALQIKEVKENLGKGGAEEVIRLAEQVDTYLRMGRYSTPYRVFRIDNDQVLDILGLEARPGFRYSFAELLPKLPLLEEQAKRAGSIKEDDRDVYNQKVIALYHNVQLYVLLARLEVSELRLIPPRNGEGKWLTPEAALQEEETTKEPYPAFRSFTSLLTYYGQGEVKDFNGELKSYRELLDQEMPGKARAASVEAYFNVVAPFYYCIFLYLFVFLLACCAWLGWTGPFNRAAFWLAVLALVVHTAGLLTRMYLTGRWFVFVTNLYSSAVFISWGAIVVGLILEAVYRNGLGNVVAGVLGALSLFVAHHLSTSGDTMGRLEAVLDTDFWLATHVTCITIGYMATFFAGLLGIIFIVRGVMTPSLDRPAVKILGQMIYGVLCFALLFSFVGTVLGGLWADKSWGRFWGWDPKENGALLIVLMNALILHARWAGLVQQRGMAVLAVVGNMVTAWSWFGTNQLGVGLHAYGFNKTLALGLEIFWASQILFLIMGLLPKRIWFSFAVQDASRPTPPQISSEAPQIQVGKRKSIAVKAR